VENLLNDEIRHQVEEAFSQLKEPVEVLFFGRQGDPEFCDETRRLVEEVITLTELR
jgi:hypothetical protein